MPHIYDNIDADLLPALKGELDKAERADFCVGYFNLRGWRQMDDQVERFKGTEQSRVRLLVGMRQSPEEELRAASRLAPDLAEPLRLRRNEGNGESEGRAMRQRKQEILRGLEAMRENLEAFADEIWATVDPKDMTTFAARTAAYAQYANAVTEFGALADKLESQVAGVPDVAPPPPPPDGATPHSLDDDFTHMKPAYYRLRGKTSPTYTYWVDLYVGFCKDLAQLNPAKFATLPADPQYCTSYGNWRFVESDARYEDVRLIMPGVYAHVHFSANSIRNLMRQLLLDFGLKVQDMEIYFA
ncbi:MAG TPA: hypothetical protein VF808_18385 [Ktedonobacterales bacterium]